MANCLSSSLKQLQFDDCEYECCNVTCRSVRTQHGVSRAHVKLLRVRRLHIRGEPDLHLEQAVRIPPPHADLVCAAYLRGVQSTQDATGELEFLLKNINTFKPGSILKNYSFPSHLFILDYN